MAPRKTSGRKTTKRKYSRAAGKSVASAVRRTKRGTLRRGKSGRGGKVTSRKQAVAIGLSEAREKGAKVPNPKRGRKRAAKGAAGTKRAAKKGTKRAGTRATKSTTKRGTKRAAKGTTKRGAKRAAKGGTKRGATRATKRTTKGGARRKRAS